MAKRNNSSETRALLIALGFGVFAILGASAIAAAPRPASKLAVMTAPWAGDYSALRVILSAGSGMVSQGRYQWIAVAYDDRPDLVGRLYRAGALLVADAAFVSACSGLTPTRNGNDK